MPLPGEITDQDTIDSLDRQAANRKMQPARLPGEITDPSAIKTLNRQQATQELLAFPRGVGKGLSETVFDAASLPIQMLGRLWGRGGVEGADIASEFAKEALSSRAPIAEPPAQPTALDKTINQYSPTLMTEYNTPEPETMGGRIAGRIGEAVGAQLPFTGGIYGAARALRPTYGPIHPSAVVPQRERLLGPIRDNPARFVTYDVLGAGGFGAAQQGAAEADLPAPVQLGAGILGAVAVPGAVTGTRAALARTMTGEWGAETGALRVPRSWREGGGGGPLFPTPPETPGGLTPAWQNAYQQLADVATRAGVPRGRVPEMLRRFEDAVGGLHNEGAPPDQAALVDFLESWKREAGGLRRAYTGAADIIGGSIEARQRGYTDKPVAPGIQTVEGRAEPFTTPYTKEVYTEKGVDAGQHARMMEQEARGLRIYDQKHHGFGSDADATAALIANNRDTEAKQLWAGVRMAGRGVDVSLQAGPNRVIALYTKLAQQLPEKIQQKVMDGIRQYLTPAGTLHPDILVLNKAKRSVSDSISDMIKPTASNTDSEAARYLTGLNQEMVRALSNIKATPRGPTNLGAVYRNANAKFAGKSEEIRHIQTGQKIYSGDLPPSAFDALPDREAKNLAKLGFHGETRRESAGKRSAADRTMMFDSPAAREKRAFLIERSQTPERGEPTRVNVPVLDAEGNPVLNARGNQLMRKERPGFDRPEHFGELVEAERRMIQTRDVARGGSQTALNQADDAVMQATDTLHGVLDALSGSKGAISAAKRLAELAYTRVMGPGADVADIKANILFTADPVLRRHHLANIEMRMGLTRFQRWQQMMADNLGRLPRRQAGGLVAGTEPREPQ